MMAVLIYKDGFHIGKYIGYVFFNLPVIVDFAGFIANVPIECA